MSAVDSMPYDPRYPVGTFQRPSSISDGDRDHAISVIAEFPEQLRQAVRGFDDDQLDMPYREGGWTVRQVVHHVADSHMTAFHRLRRALTEDWPEVHGYNEKAFNTLPDHTAPVEWSLEILESLHARWVMVLHALTEEQWSRGFRHAERGPSRLDEAMLLYAWHSRHHLAHITHLCSRQGW